ncbi:MAG: DUF1566 domain-containing protein [Turneriella sp.]
MSKKSFVISLLPVMLLACGGGFEKFAPPANSISGRGAKQKPKIISTTPSDGASVSPVTGTTGSQIRVIFDMTMNTSTTPVINTYVRDIESSTGWYSIANSGTTFTWSSTNFANDTLTIQLGWVRWPENNIIGFDFRNETLINLDEMPLDNEKIYTFTVTWNSARYKTVHTGQWGCVYYSPGTGKWEAVQSANCNAPSILGDPAIGTQDFPAGQNGFVDPMNPTYGPGLYGAGSAGTSYGRRFSGGDGAHPQNVNSTNCNGLNTDACYPYSADSVTNLVWKTCGQGQAYTQNVAGGDRCLSSGNDFTWGEAVNACSALNSADGGQGYGGRRDWRLPTLEELESLVDYGAHDVLGASEDVFEMPAIHGYAADNTAHGPFPNTRVEKGYWTATGVSLYNSGTTYYSNAYVAEFKNGFVGAGGSSGALLESTRKSANRKKVRCVAGPTVEPSAQNLTTGVALAGSALNTISAAFTGYDPTTSFTLDSVVPVMNTVNHTLRLNFRNIPANDSIPAVPSNASLVYNNQTPGFKNAIGSLSLYCIDRVSTPTCPGSSYLTVASATVPTSPANNTVTLKITTASGGIPPLDTYRLYITPFPIATNPCSPNCTATTPNTISLVQNTSIFRSIDFSNFDISAAVPASATTINVTFNKIPQSAGATSTANYRICPTAVWCGASLLTINSATLSGRTVTLTLDAGTPQVAGNSYYVVTQNITFLGNHIVTDSVNRKIWQRCRHGLNDSPTCDDDGLADNDTNYWNDDLNYCNQLNAWNFANYNSGWRAPTINELKSIADRSRLGTAALSVDTTIFPTPNALAEDFASSTTKMKNGDPGVISMDHAWTFNFVSGFPAIVRKDNSGITNPALKPQQKNIRCVRSY